MKTQAVESGESIGPDQVGPLRKRTRLIGVAALGALLITGGLAAMGLDFASRPARASGGVTAVAPAAQPAGVSAKMERSNYEPITPLARVRVETHPTYAGPMTGVEKSQWRETFGMPAK